MVLCRQLLAPAGNTLSVGLSLRPHDPIAKKLVSREVPVQNLLLRVTTPRRTGRKRKRGSNDPFSFPADHVPLTDEHEGITASEPLEASKLLQRMRDNPSKYSVQPIGHIKQAHRFRGIPCWTGSFFGIQLTPRQHFQISRSRLAPKQS